MTTTFKSNLNIAFKALRKMGYFARQNFMCCQSCAWAAVPDEKGERAVFYHNQDASGIPDGKLYLAWSGNGTEIVEVLSEYFNVTWDGDASHRIFIESK